MEYVRGHNYSYVLKQNEILSALQKQKENYHHDDIPFNLTENLHLLIYRLLQKFAEKLHSVSWLYKVSGKVAVVIGCKNPEQVQMQIHAKFGEKHFESEKNTF